jgi:PAS domain-containing protein
MPGFSPSAADSTSSAATAVRPGADDGLLWVEDFESFPVGPLCTDPGPSPDHHFHKPAGYRGRWLPGSAETGPDAPDWHIVDTDGRHVLEQSAPRLRRPAVLVVGDPDWTDLSVRLRLRPMGTGACGLVLRFRDGRGHYLLSVADGLVRLTSRMGEEVRTLSQAAADPAGEWMELAAQTAGELLRCSLDGVELFAVRDGLLPRGRAGVFAEGPAQFAALRIACTGEARRRVVATAERRARELEEIRRRMPRPRLWRKLSTEGFGGGRCLRVGDVNGDGRPELLTVQARRRGDAEMVGCVTAMDIDGRVLWRFGEPVRRPEPSLPAGDLPVQIHDLDGDGSDEIVVAREFHLHILDGRTGKVRHRVPTPPRAGGGPGFGRVAGTALAFADLSGKLRPGELLFTDGLSRVWAFDSRLEPLWRAECDPAGGVSSLLAYDFDGDGREEILAGGTLLDPDGQEIWTIPLDDKVRAAMVIRPPGSRDLRIVLAAGEEGVLFADRDGRVVFEDRSAFGHGLAGGRFRPDLAGPQIACQGRGDSAGMLCLLDATGRRIAETWLFPAAGPLCPVNWAGGAGDLLLLNAHPVHGGLADGAGRVVVELPDDGHPTLCCRALPLSGGPRDEILCWDPGRIWIYTPDGPPPAGAAVRRRRPDLHSDSVWRAEISE